VGGPHAVEAALAGRHEVLQIFVEEGPGKKGGVWSAEARKAGVPVISVPREECDRLAETRAQGVAAELRFAHSELEDVLAVEGGTVVFLDGIVDPHNVGAILRTAEAAGAAGAVIPARRSAGITSAVVRASVGAALSLPVVRVVNLVQAMRTAKSAGMWLTGLDHRADAEIEPTQDTNARIGLVVGGEAEGLHRLAAETCDELARLPMVGMVESLNASVAAGIALYRLCEPRLFGRKSG
jgi:23S rRNA (guanosine2251-2'-O)-methyltransferase